MSEENPKPGSSNQPIAWSSQADALFKKLTRAGALQLGLQAFETEFQHMTTLRADLVLSVPPDISLEGTMFDFFRTVNVLEFKSQNDLLTPREFIKNQIRTDLQLLQSEDEDYQNILNVIVSSRAPKDFLSYAEGRGILFRQVEAKPWLWLNQNGFQNIAIVVCIDLPLESRFEDWLLFAPAGSRKWQKLVLSLLSKGDRRRLGLARKMRPKEFKMLTNEKYDEILAEVFGDPDLNLEEDDDEPIELSDMAEIILDELAHEDPTLLSKVYASRSPEERLAGLKPEDRLAGLKPEDLLSGLKPEDREELLKLLQEQSKRSRKRGSSKKEPD